MCELVKKQLRKGPRKNKIYVLIMEGPRRAQQILNLLSNIFTVRNVSPS